MQLLSEPQSRMKNNSSSTLCDILIYQQINGILVELKIFPYRFSLSDESNVAILVQVCHIFTETSSVTV